MKLKFTTNLLGTLLFLNMINGGFAQQGQDSGETTPVAPGDPAQPQSGFEGAKPGDKPKQPLDENFQNPFKSYTAEAKKIAETVELPVGKDDEVDPVAVLMDAVRGVISTQSVSGIIRAASGVSPKVVVNEEVFGVDDSIGAYQSGAFVPAVTGADIRLVNIGDRDLTFRVTQADIDETYDVPLHSFLHTR